MPEPHDFTVRKIRRSSAAPLASIASLPASVTIAIRPLWGGTIRGCKDVSTERKSEKFLKLGLDSFAKQPARANQVVRARTHKFLPKADIRDSAETVKIVSKLTISKTERDKARL
jgi:hypothetical protein